MPKLKYLVLVLSTALSGCLMGPNFHHPPAPCTQSYTKCPLPEHTVSAPTCGGKAQTFAADQDIPGQWWKLYHSEELNYLVCKGIANNPNLQAAQATLLQAKENLYALAGSTMLPSATLSGFAERERFALSSIGLGTNIVPNDVFNLYNVQIGVAYTVDVFGALRRQVEASGALAESQCFQRDATYITLTGNIITTAIAAASLRAQIAATHRLIEETKDVLNLVCKQKKLGAVSAAEVLTQQTQLAQTIATLPPLEKSLAQTNHALAVLVGELPSESELPCINLDDLELPSCLPTSIPSRLVRQRPDIRASEALVHQASANIGVATANLFPQFTFSSTYGYESLILPHLISPQTKFWDIIGAFSQPIFQGGSLWAKRRASIDAYHQACAQYKQTVLQGFQNVADSLRAVQMDAGTLKAQAAAEHSARGTLDLTKKQYKLGAVSFLNVLTAERQYQQAVITRIQAQAARYSDTAALFVALGGGWWNECPPVINTPDCRCSS